MKDVAALAGVSLKTVSRVVNREAGVSEELSARVSRAAEQLDYRPNLTASNLRRSDQRTGTIGLLVEDVANEFFASIHRGCRGGRARARRRRHRREPRSRSRPRARPGLGLRLAAGGRPHPGADGQRAGLPDQRAPQRLAHGLHRPPAPRRRHRRGRDRQPGGVRLRRGAPHRPGAHADRVHRRPVHPLDRAGPLLGLPRRHGQGGRSGPAGVGAPRRPGQRPGAGGRPRRARAGAGADSHLQRPEPHHHGHRAGAARARAPAPGGTRRLRRLPAGRPAGSRDHRRRPGCPRHRSPGRRAALPPDGGLPSGRPPRTSCRARWSLADLGKFPRGDGDPGTT